MWSDVVLELIDEEAHEVVGGAAVYCKCMILFDKISKSQKEKKRFARPKNVR
jgi:hypothetical protein